jgi:predicted MFS family arabinose efflux permease
MMFVLCGASGLVFAVILWKQLPSRGGSNVGRSFGKRISIREVGPLLRKPSFLAILGAFSLIAIVFWVLFSYLPLFIFERYQLSLESAAFQATFYMQVSAVILIPIFGAVYDIWTVRRERNRFLACALVCMLGIPALIAIGTGNHAAILVGGLIMFGLVMAGTDASWLPMLCSITSRHQRAIAYGLLNTSGTLAGGCAAMATALMMKSFGLGSIITFLGALFVLMAVMLSLVAYRLLDHDRVPDLQQEVDGPLG